MRTTLSRIMSALLGALWLAMLVQLYFALFHQDDQQQTLRWIFWMLFMLYVPRHFKRMIKFFQVALKPRPGVADAPHRR